MVNEQNSLVEIQDYFAQDRFATETGCVIVEAKAGYCVAEMPITEHLLNANHTVMGGATFTLADFAMAVAANLDDKPTVSIACNIRFFGVAKGSKLIATCTTDKAGRRVGFYRVDVTDDLGIKVASYEATASRS